MKFISIGNNPAHRSSFALVEKDGKEFVWERTLYTNDEDQILVSCGQRTSFEECQEVDRLILADGESESSEEDPDVVGISVCPEHKQFAFSWHAQRIVTWKVVKAMEVHWPSAGFEIVRELEIESSGGND